jgi:hypothetical protein
MVGPGIISRLNPVSKLVFLVKTANMHRVSYFYLNLKSSL